MPQDLVTTTSRGGGSPALMAALPAWTYRSAELLELEYEELFLKTWQIACHVNDLQKPRSYLTFDLLRDSILILRDEEGTLRAFKNVCRHRAARLADRHGECPRRLVCPYHGWTYKLSGELASVPEEGTFPGLDKSRYSLMPVELEVFQGFVFVRVVDDGGPSVAELWEGQLDRLEPYDLPGMVRLEESWETIWDVNWKVAVDNNLENYHVPMSHPGYNRLLENQLHGRTNQHGVSSSLSYLREKPGKNWTWSERAYQKLAQATLGERPGDLGRRWTFFSMLPSLGVDIYPDCMDFFQILPLGPRRSLVRTMIYGHPDTRREMRALRYLNARINGQVGKEDFELCSRVQSGLETAGYELGPLSTIESGVRDFHEFIQSRLPAATLRQEPEPGELRRLNARIASGRTA